MMNKEEAIKYLQQLYPNGGHCWLDEQRIEAIGMAIKALQEEPEFNASVEEAMAEVEEKAKAFTEAHKSEDSEQLLAQMRGEEPTNEDLEKEIEFYMKTHLKWNSDALRDPIESWGIKIARHFANWQKEQDKKGFSLLKEWFDDIAEKCGHLTSGNVSHNGKMIRGYARNCAEYIETDLL